MCVGVCIKLYWESEERDKFMEDCKGGIHIHTPNYYVVKDGPSGGVAFAVAFMSVISEEMSRVT